MDRPLIWLPKSQPAGERAPLLPLNPAFHQASLLYAFLKGRLTGRGRRGEVCRPLVHASSDSNIQLRTVRDTGPSTWAAPRCFPGCSSRELMRSGSAGNGVSTRDASVTSHGSIGHATAPALAHLRDPFGGVFRELSHPGVETSPLAAAPGSGSKKAIIPEKMPDASSVQATWPCHLELCHDC